VKGIPSVIANAVGRLEIFVVGSNGQSTWHNWQTSSGGAWLGWNPLATGVTAPSVARNADGRLEAFYLDSQSAVWHTFQTAAGSATWSTPAPLAGWVANSPTALANADGRLEIFAGNNSTSYHNWQGRKTVGDHAGIPAGSGPPSMR
jgi:hypothetical protein